MPSTPNTPESVFADWMLVVLRTLEASHPNERFALMLDAGVRSLELTCLDGAALPASIVDRFEDDCFEAYEVLIVLRDQHAARAAFLMAFLRAARTLAA